MQRFLDDIEALVNETVDMGNLASEMIEKSVQAIVDGNVELADEVIDDFSRVDRYDNEIEEAAIRILRGSTATTTRSRRRPSGSSRSTSPPPWTPGR